MGEWSNLTQREKSNIIRFAIKNGVSDINQIRDTFNVYAKDSLANVDYNMAAAKAAGFGSNGNGHYPDTFKKPNHPTFSDESIYHSEATPGGRWRGNTYEPSEFVLNQQGGWNQFLKSFYNQEHGTGAVPVFNGGVMLPEVTVTPQYKDGGEIYIKPSKKGTFTAAATKHGKSVQEFARQVLANKENYSPAMVRKANFARNAAHWHGDGGGLFSWLQGLFGEKEPQAEQPKPKETGRVRRNDSPTQSLSEKLENRMHRYVTSGETNTKNPVNTSTAYDIPYIMDKEIKVGGVGRVSSNALDSTAKYAAQAGIPLYEALGLAAQETGFGAVPVMNYKNGDTEYNRALGNASYFRNFGSIPAQYFVRDFEYDKGAGNKGMPYDRNLPPLLHAFLYWKRGKYNPRDPNHTKAVRAKGKMVMQDPAIQKWFQERGQKIYNSNQKKTKKSTGGPLYPFSFSHNPYWKTPIVRY